MLYNFICLYINSGTLLSGTLKTKITEIAVAAENCRKPFPWAALGKEMKQEKKQKKKNLFLWWLLTAPSWAWSSCHGPSMGWGSHDSEFRWFRVFHKKNRQVLYSLYSDFVLTLCPLKKWQTACLPRPLSLTPVDDAHLTLPPSMTPFLSYSHILHQNQGLSLTPSLCRWRVCPVNDKGGVRCQHRLFGLWDAFGHCKIHSGSQKPNGY